LNGPAVQERQYVASLTGFRGVAALFVFCFHYSYFNTGIRLDLAVPVIGKLLHFPFGFGFSGVDIFFVLSGFLLSLPFARASLAGSAHQPLGRYYKRRVLRVFPAYYAQLAIILAVGGWFVTWHPLDATALLAHAFMFFNIGWNPVQPLVGIWWTLPVEFSFYLLLPLIAPFMRPGKWMIILLGGIAISFLYRVWAADHFADAPGGAVFLAASQIPGALPEFLLGASAALLVQWLGLRTRIRLSAGLLDVLFLAGAFLVGLWFWQVTLPNGNYYWAGHWNMLVAPLALGLPLSVMVASLYLGSRLGRWLFANPVVYYLGLISYSLYLWHFIVLQQAPLVFGEAYAALQGVPRFLASLSLVVLAASVSYFLFERPFFRLGSRRKSAARA